MERGDDIETTVLLALIGLIAGELVDRARRNEAAAIARRRELDQIRRRAELAAGGERPGRLIEMSAAELTEILDLKACRYVPTPAPETLPVFTHTAIVVPSVMNDDAPHGAVALPVRAHDRDLGHFLLVFPPPSDRVPERSSAVPCRRPLGPSPRVGPTWRAVGGPRR
jgi:hypothetical protein